MQMSEQEHTLPQSMPELASRVLNHEAKLMILMSLEGQPTALTAWHLNKAMTEPQQDYATWVPNNMAAYSYCSQSLAPAGTVAEEIVPSRQRGTKAYKLTEYGQRLAVPAAGFLLDWSLRYPDVSLQNLLGRTNTTGEIRAGETRIRVLEEALACPPQDNLSIRAVFAENVDPDSESLQYKRERNRISKAIKALGLASIVHSETIEFDDDRELLIVDPEMPEGVANHPNYEVARALYDVISTLNAERTDRDTPLTLGYNDAVVLTHNRLAEQGIEVDPVKVRVAIHNAYFNEAVYKGITKADPARFNDGKLTRFSINDLHRDAAEEFITILQVLEDETERTHQEGLALLQSVKRNPAQRAQIMSKAFVFSPFAQKKSTLTTATEVEALVAELGEVTLDDLTSAYRDKVGRPLKSESIRNVLVLLTSQGRIAVEAAANSEKPGYGLKRNVYTLAA